MPRQPKDPIEKALKRALENSQDAQERALFTRALANHWADGVQSLKKQVEALSEELVVLQRTHEETVAMLCEECRVKVELYAAREPDQSWVMA